MLAPILRTETSDLQDHVALDYLPFEGWEFVPSCLGFGFWDLGFTAAPAAVSMAENNLVGLNGSDSLARSRVAPAGNP